MPGQVAAVVLAAGCSQRMGGESKLLLPLDGKPVIRWVAECLVAAGVRDLVVVVGDDETRVRGALRGLDVGFASAPEGLRGSGGMGVSIATGVRALGCVATVVLIALGDMPFVAPTTVRGLVDRCAPEGGGIVTPVRHGRRGHPVVFDLTRYRAELLALSGDRGARSILSEHADDVSEFPVDDPGVHFDLDTPGDYERARALVLNPHLLTK